MNTKTATHFENMRPADAAAYIGVSRDTLAKWRCIGQFGPPFVKISASCVVYRKTDIDDWMTRRTFLSTAAADQAGREIGAA